MSATNRTLVVIGSGPGIGRSVAALFASKRYNNVALISRRPEQLALEREAIEAVGQDIKVRTFAVDVADTEALLGALGEAEAHFGKAECIFYNASRVLPSKLLEHDIKEVELDLKANRTPVTHINVLALYAVAQREIPQLLEMARTDPLSMPSLIVTSSHLPLDPMPQLFALSLAKAAQRNLMTSLNMAYASEGVHIGLINVGGIVSPEEHQRNPTNIALRAWDWFSRSKESPTFEVKI